MLHLARDHAGLRTANLSVTAAARRMYRKQQGSDAASCMDGTFPGRKTVLVVLFLQNQRNRIVSQDDVNPGNQECTPISLALTNEKYWDEMPQLETGWTRR
jgi:hypothetical protein